jgi:hypothetical protein
LAGDISKDVSVTGAPPPSFQSSWKLMPIFAARLKLGSVSQAKATRVVMGKGEANGFFMGFPDGLSRLDWSERSERGTSHPEQIPSHDINQPWKVLPIYLSNVDTFKAWVPVLDRKA